MCDEYDRQNEPRYSKRPPDHVVQGMQEVKTKVIDIPEEDMVDKLKKLRGHARGRGGQDVDGE